jgi:hypothetical protein
MISAATFLTFDHTPLRKRGVMQGIANAWYGTSAMLGAVIRKLIQDQTAPSWRFAICVRMSPSLLLIPATCTLMKAPCKQVQETQTISSRTDRIPRRLLHRLLPGPLDPRPDFRRQLDTMDAPPAADNVPPFGDGGWGR